MEYLIIVTAPTRLQLLLKRYNTKGQVKFYLESQGSSYADYEEEHNTYLRSVEIVQRQLSGRFKYKLLDRDFLPNFLFAPEHLVLAIGQDGLVANTAKYTKGQSIIGVNPNPQRFDGILLPFQPTDVAKVVTATFAQRAHTRQVHFAEAKLDDGQRLLAFNDLFIGTATHLSARYAIQYGEQKEIQSSSGLLVATQAGSTAWLSSLFNMVNGFNKAFGVPVIDLPSLMPTDLFFAVREPFASLSSQAHLTNGMLRQGQQLRLHSQMPQHGVIFSDGIQKDFLQFNAGRTLTIGLAKEYARLVTEMM